MRAAILALERAKRKALESIESATANAKPAAYIGSIEHDVTEYDRALAVLQWADRERCILIRVGL